MKEWTAIIKDDGIIQIQSAPYIEHGCFVEIRGKEIYLFEIPYGGGQENLVGKFETIIEAINFSETLT